jgi:DNA-binding CsgD family transcriptional regulator
MIDSARTLEEQDQRSPVYPEQAAMLAKRAIPTVFIIDRRLRVQYFRANPAERRKDFLPLGDGSMPPALEYAILKLFTHDPEPENGVWRAALSGSVALRVLRLDGPGPSAAFAVTVERVGVRDQLLALASRYGLSTRERQVLNLVVKGLRNEEIAEHLCISKSTAIFHVKQLLTKTNSRNRTEIVAKIIG